MNSKMHNSNEKQKMDNNPLVSIIVITYNSSRYVLETLESAKSQTYQNIELIISDDGSSDNTIKICSNWIDKNKKRFTRTIIIDPCKNSGIPANCNRGIASSQGDWIKLIAGDDLLENNCISDNLNFALESDSSFVFSELIYFSDNKTKYADNIKENSIRQEFSRLEAESQLKVYSRYPMFLNSPTWFYKKTEMAKYDEEFRYIEDQPFIFRNLSNNIKINYLDKTTVRYRKHGTSVQVGNPHIIDEFIYCYKKYRKRNLSSISLIDLMFKINLLILVIDRKAPKNILIGYLLILIRKLNPVALFKISPIAAIRN